MGHVASYPLSKLNTYTLWNLEPDHLPASVASHRVVCAFPFFPKVKRRFVCYLAGLLIGPLSFSFLPQDHLFR